MPWLTKGNSDLSGDGIYSWTLPALGARLSDGTTIKTCPNAGACASLCYARTGNFMFENVKKAHVRNLEHSMTPRFIESILNELHHKRFAPTGSPAAFVRLLNMNALTPWQRDWAVAGGKAVRIHDSGDFYSARYMQAWLDIVRLSPHIFFYAYTKEIALAKSIERPRNLTFIFSMGGKQDNMIDTAVDRHSEVVPNITALLQAGYTHNLQSDILAALMESNKVGLLRNNIAALKRKQGLKTFGELQVERGG